MEVAGVKFATRTDTLWTASCFLHQDRIPSLSVSPRKGLFNCFSTGCEAKGDLISFYAQFYNLSVFEAVQKCAEDFGVELKNLKRDTKYDKEIEEGEKRKVGYSASLWSPKGRKAREYLISRGVNDATIRTYQLGFDISRNLLVFPVVHPIDGRTCFHFGVYGAVRGGGPKYMGPSGQDNLRWPGQTFGLQHARKHLRKERKLILVEGFFDVLVPHSNGIENIASLLGSHPTQAQVDLLHQLHIPECTLMLDPDAAGNKGIEQMAELDNKGIRFRVARDFEGDPDEFIIANGRSKFEHNLGEAIPLVQFYIDEAEKKGTLEDVYKRSDAIRHAAGLIRNVGGLDGEVGINDLCARFSIHRDTLTELLASNDFNEREVVESERRVLASFIAEPSKTQEAGPIQFGIPTHQKIYQAIIKFCQERATEISEGMLRKAVPEANSIIGFITKMEAQNFDYHLAKVREAAIRRNLASIGSSLKANAQDRQRDVSRLISTHLTQVSDVMDQKKEASHGAYEQVESAMQYIEERVASQGTLPGLDLGEKWKNLMDTTLGFQNGYMYLLAASPKAGKTSIAQNWAMELAVKRKIPTLWINLEMGTRDLALRNLSILSGVSNSRLRKGELLEKEHSMVARAGQLYAQAPFHLVNAQGSGINEIVAVMRKHVYSKGVKVIFLDYIQLISINTRDTAYWEGHAQISSQLKSALTEHLSVPLIGISQLSRGAALAGSTSGEYMGGAYKYIQDCDVFMGLRGITKKEIDEGMPGNAVLSVEYNRHGPQEVYTRLQFDRQNLRIEEIL